MNPNSPRSVVQEYIFSLSLPKQCVISEEEKNANQLTFCTFKVLDLKESSKKSRLSSGWVSNTYLNESEKIIGKSQKKVFWDQNLLMLFMI